MSSTIFAAIQDPLKQLVAELVRAERLREEVTYRRYTGQVFDKNVGYTVNTYDNDKLGAVRMRHTQSSVKVSTSNVQVGDVLFLFDGVSFPVDSSLKDLVVDAKGNELGIKGIDPIFGFAVCVTIAGAK